ncbi:hypothetical protein [Streptomyces sp. NPDC059247]|uniref:hypothetical protein n=1 Tax=Streptomyces sp. NPDC059247 TaxID=3346790 RepID=UPI00367F886F
MAWAPAVAVPAVTGFFAGGEAVAPEAVAPEAVAFLGAGEADDFFAALVAAVAFFGAEVLVAPPFEVPTFAVPPFDVPVLGAVVPRSGAADFRFTAFARFGTPCSPTAELPSADTLSAPLACALTGELDTRPA